MRHEDVGWTTFSCFIFFKLIFHLKLWRMCDTNLKSSIEAALLYWWWPSCSYTIVRSNKAIGVTMDPPVRNESQMKVILDSGIVTFRDTSRSTLQNVRRSIMGDFHLFLDIDCKSMYICNQSICAINMWYNQRKHCHSLHVSKWNVRLCCVRSPSCQLCPLLRKY